LATIRDLILKPTRQFPGAAIRIDRVGIVKA